MFGKAAFILILSFSTLFMSYQQRLITSSNSAVDTYSLYYCRTAGQYLATTGANLALNQVFLTPNWSTGYDSLSLNGGTIKVTVVSFGSNMRRVTSISKFMGVLDTVEVVLQPSNFSRFGYYASNMPSNLYYATGDTVWGPMHVQGTLNVIGSPVFMGRVTTQNGIKKYNTSDTPQFLGGYQGGVNLSYPNSFPNVAATAAAGGKVFTNTDVYMTFNADATVTYKLSSSGTATTAALSVFAPNGVINVSNGNLHLQGTVSGQYTVSATTGSTSTSGNIYIDNDIVYKTSRTNPSNTDMLGIVAQKNVIISDVPANKNDVYIDGSIFSLTGGLAAQNYDHIGYCGSIRVFGGLVENTSQATGVWNGSTVSSGYSSKLAYDARYMLNNPPAYPASGTFNIMSWRE